jgi:D-beta-D-heptose 7-phosphate kinase/D-beta-D-heptose 1-phosphate adenosyltransferase
MSYNVSDILHQFLELDILKYLEINVVGDVMLDEYYEVEVERISPEFPIPVYKSTNFDPCSVVPGGAANVAYQFTHFNVDANLISCMDKMGEVIFNAKGIKTNNSKVINSCVMPVKRRIYSHNLPLVRHDVEKENYGLEDIKKYLFDLQVPEADFTIFSDYSKGIFCCPWFRKFIKKNKNIVDPKNSFIDIWEGCTYFKPNSFEAEKLSERKNIHDQLEFFIDALKCEGVLITQSGAGVTGKLSDGKFFEVRPNRILPSPESVIGAGDCFVAFMSMALARGMNLEKAAQLAFTAGCCYVQKRQNTPLTPAELLKFAGVKEVKNPRILAKRDFKLAFSNGCFDMGLTAAHIECLKFAKSQADQLVVAINSDESVRKLKGSGRPIMNLAERIKVISSLDFVDFVVGFEEDTPYETIKGCEPDVIVKGGDYKKEQVVGNDLADVIIFPFIDGVSTTEKIKKISNLS